jgi:two-component system CheB/CheR fusion protein
LSVNEEFQSTNEELLTSKEELQSLNEELTALNSQLQETLERQRTTSNDLQNVLYSTDVATLFLDTDLNIRFFTPATKSLFNVIPGDIGRPLADLRSLAADDAAGRRRAVLKTSAPIEREIEGAERRLVFHPPHPALYRTQDTGSRASSSPSPTSPSARRAADALEIAKGQAELANRPSRASSPPPATTCASRCKPWRCCRACWRTPSKATGRRATGRASR